MKASTKAAAIIRAMRAIQRNQRMVFAIEHGNVPGLIDQTLPVDIKDQTMQELSRLCFEMQSEIDGALTFIDHLVSSTDQE